MIKLEKVSKIYYQNGVIASGFNNVSLEFNMGEFIAIVGESGSGKSTLLNVISGLDTYEEGEMYINGEETSHYSKEDFEEYRRKYVANIFQTFNLVNSYTVKQNIELVLLLHGYGRKEIKEKVNNILNQVGLYKIRNKKASRLSGGQKQRVAIARALAKETPIIVADEPTGNLDSKSAAEIYKLLEKISKDKLVVIVTHNYEQIENLVTRVIKMHDGKVVEDKKIKNYEKCEVKESIRRKMSIGAKAKLGFRNTFNIFYKFALTLLVFLVLVGTIVDKVANIEKGNLDKLFEEIDRSVYVDQNPTRLIVKRADNSIMTENDYQYFKTINNVKSINEKDTSDIKHVFMTNDGLYRSIEASVKPMSEFKGKITEGKITDKNDVLIVEAGNYELFMGDDLFGQVINPLNQETWEPYQHLSYKVTAKSVDQDKNSVTIEMYVNDEVMDELIQVHYFNLINPTIKINKKNIEEYEAYLRVSPLVNPGEVYMSKDMNSYCKNQYCNTEKVIISNSSIYFEKTKELTVKGLVSSKGMKKYCDDCMTNQIILISPQDMKELSFNGYYQTSIYATDISYVDSIKKDLEEHGYKPLALKDTIKPTGDIKKLINFITGISIVITVVVIVFISSFILNAILKSKNRYYAVVRILGGNLKICRELINIELFIVSTIAYAIIIGTYYYLFINNIGSQYVTNPFDYLKIYHYVLIYISVVVISQYLSYKFSKSIFKDSMITTYNMEV